MPLSSLYEALNHVHTYEGNGQVQNRKICIIKADVYFDFTLIS